MQIYHSEYLTLKMMIKIWPKTCILFDLQMIEVSTGDAHWAITISKFPAEIDKTLVSRPRLTRLLKPFSRVSSGL